MKFIETLSRTAGISPKTPFFFYNVQCDILTHGSGSDSSFGQHEVKSLEARLLWSYHHETIDTPGVCTKDRKEKFKLNHAIISEKKKPYLWLFVDCPFESKDVKANRVKEL